MLEYDSATLEAAAEALDREPVACVIIDWAGDGTSHFDDVTDAVQSVTSDRQLATDLPDEVRTVSGLSASVATVVLGGSVRDAATGTLWPVAEVLSPYAGTTEPSLTDRLNRRATIDLGFITAAGPEYVRHFTGLVDAVTVNEANGQVTVELIDYRPLLSAPVSLPVILADDHGIGATTAKRGGLNAQHVMDRVLRAGGFYHSPPTRAQPVLHAPLNGAAVPLVGTLDYAYKRGQAGDVAGPLPYATGRWGLGLAGYDEVTPPDTARSEVRWHIDTGNPITTNNGQSVLMEMWGDLNVSDTVYLSIDGSTDVLRVLVDGSRHVQVGLRRPSLSLATATSSGTLPAASTYIGVTWQMTTGGATVRVKIGDAAEETLTITQTGSSSFGVAYAHAYVWNPASRLEALQITTEAWSSSVWGNEFEPTALLDMSINQLTATPPGDSKDGWAVLQELADAEQGVGYFREDGVYVFLNRSTLRAGSVVAELTTDRHLKELAYRESLDAIRNVVRTTVHPLVLGPLEILWTAAEIYRIPASSTRYVWATFEGSVAEVDTSMGFAGGGYTVAAGSAYRAARTVYGSTTVSNLIITIEAFTDSAKITFSNPNAYEVYLVNPAGFPDDAGLPSITVVGRVLVDQSAGIEGSAGGTGGVRVEARDTSSEKDKWGERILELPDNPWRQDSNTTQVLVDDLLSMLYRPRAYVTGLSMRGDPRRQLTDAVQLTDTGRYFSDDVYLAGIATSLSVGGGLEQTLTVRDRDVT